MAIKTMKTQFINFIKFFTFGNKLTKHIILSFLFFILLATWLGFFVRTQATRLPSGFINADFRSQVPSDLNIIYALYGNGTAGNTSYTKNRTGSCIPTSVSTSFPNTLSANTIYVLSGDYSKTSQIIFNGDCIALIGRGRVTVTISWSIRTWFYISWRQNIIIDNIRLNGNYKAQHWIYMYNSSNNTINNSQVYDTTGSVDSRGILVTNYSYNNFINNTQTFNNLIWLAIIDNSHHNIVNNFQGYNNREEWMEINTDARYNSVNNSQFYNNGDWLTWIWLKIWSNYNTLNNIMIYNNALVGLRYSSHGWHLNNVYSYNNRTWVYTDDTATWNTYYWALKVFGNDCDFFGTEYPPTSPFQCMIPPSAYLTGWSTFSLFSGALSTTYFWWIIMYYPSRTAWSINTGNTIWSTWITNPQNGNNVLLVSWTNWSTSNRWYRLWSWVQPILYFYGSGIFKQITPVKYLPDSPLWPYWVNNYDYNTLNYIWEIEWTLTSQENSLIDKYFWPNSDYTKNRESNDCTLSAFSIEYLTTLTWTWPTTLNTYKIYVLNSWEYVTNWINMDWNCIGLIWNWNVSIRWKDCSTSTNGSIIYSNNKNNIIIDNIKLIWNNDIPSRWRLCATQSAPNPDCVISSTLTCENNYGIKFNWASSSNTISNAVVYDSYVDGIYIWTNSHHNTIMNTQTLNNNEYGIFMSYVSSYNVINNSLSFNNDGYGIWFANWSFRNTINNSQFYNNTVGIFWDLTTTENIINNVHTYNNSQYGIYFKNSSSNLLNKVRSYNNNVWINLEYVSSSNTYYWDLNLFDNPWWNISWTSLTAWSSGPLDRSNGNLISNWSTISCDYVTNIYSWYSDNPFFTTFPDSGCNITWYKSYDTIITNIWFGFGNQISKQIAPARYVLWTVTWLISQYDSWKYIWEVNAVRYTYPWTLTFTTISDWQFNTLYTSNIVSIGWSINKPVNITLTLSPSNSSGRLVVSWVNWLQIWTSFTNVTIPFTIQAYIISATWYYQMISWAINIWTAQYWSSTWYFLVTTRWPDSTPDTFSFQSFTWIEINTSTWSMITVSGIETWVRAYISWWRIATYSWWQAIDLGVWPFLVYSWNQIRAFLTWSSDYGVTITWVVTIWLLTWSFSVGTTPDIYPPIISFISWPSSSWYRNNTIEIDFSWANDYSWYTFVTDTWDCITWLTLSSFSWYWWSFIISWNNQNGKYICARARDLWWNITMLASSGSINLSYISFSSSVDSWPVAIDTIAVNFENTYNNKYKFVSTWSLCDSSSSLDYSWSISVNTTWYNWLYFCAYGEDASGSWKTLLSTYPVNVDVTLPYINLADDVSSGRVLTDTITVNFTWWTFPIRKYKFVTDTNDCDSWSTSNFSSSVTVNTETNNNKYFCAFVQDSSWHQITLTSTYSLQIDITAPTVPLLIYPYNWEDVFFTIFERSWSTDNWIWISGYNYVLAEDHSFNYIITDWFVTWDSVVIPDFYEITWIFYWKINAVDKLNHTSSRSLVGYFNAVDDENFFFDAKNWADLNTYYDSDEITIGWLNQWMGIRASITNGTLYKNGKSKWTSTVVQNGDELRIKLRSSKKYNKTVSSTLTIANREADFLLKTYEQWHECDLYSWDKAKILAIYNILKNTYSGSNNSTNFFNTLQSMLQDQIDLSGSCNLQYLSDLINASTTIEHIAPNCKKYIVNYDNTRMAYYSSTFKVVHYFATLDSMRKYIDAKNPGNCNINFYSWDYETYNNSDVNRHVAPNWKIYYIQSTTNWYTASNFITKKYFTTIQALNAYIDKNNPAQNLWNHTIDTSFSPLIYSAPNGKVYTIYKTNRWYMSYRLIDVHYFQTLATIQAYINKNNQH